MQVLYKLIILREKKSQKSKKFKLYSYQKYRSWFFFYHVSISESLMIMKSIFTNETGFSEMNENDV